MTSRQSLTSADRASASEKHGEERRNESVISLKELEREDGDGAVDEVVAPVESGVDDVDTDTTRHNPPPPNSPPPASSPRPPPSGTTVEIRVHAKRCGSSSSRGGGGGSRPTSSTAHRPPSSAADEQTVGNEPTVVVAAAAADVGGEHPDETAGVIADDNAATTAVATTDLTASSVDAAEAQSADRISLQSQAKNNPPTSAEPATVDETQEGGDNSSSSRPTTSRGRSLTNAEERAPVGDEHQADVATTSAQDNATTAAETDELAAPVHAEQEALVDREALDNEEHHMTASDAAADSTVDPVTQVQLQGASENPEAESDHKTVVSDDQQNTQVPEQQQQETKIASSEADHPVEPEAVNSADQPKAVVSTNDEMENTPEETVDGELPATESKASVRCAKSVRKKTNS